MFLGKYSRIRPLVFSLVPRCCGACGSGKNTCVARHSASSLYRANSVPRSGVTVRTRLAGKAPSNSIMTSLTVSAFTLAVRLESRYRDLRSTSVTNAECPVFPRTVSPSQCPNQLRFSADRGRSWIDGASLKRPRRSLIVPLTLLVLPRCRSCRFWCKVYSGRVHPVS